MALLTKKEFADLCDMATNALSVYIKRGKVVLSGDFIDDQFPPNAEFLQKRKKKPVSANEDKSPKYSEPQLKQQTPNVQAPKPDSWELSEALRRQELLKKEAETRLLNLREEKIRGEVVPVDLVKQFFVLHNQSIMTAQKDSIEYLIVQFSKEVRLSGEQLAAMRGKMTLALNEGLRKSVELTNRNMKSVIEGFSMKREVGEHD